MFLWGHEKYPYETQTESSPAVADCPSGARCRMGEKTFGGLILPKLLGGRLNWEPPRILTSKKTRKLSNIVELNGIEPSAS
jgi:hypothetical protein